MRVVTSLTGVVLLSSVYSCIAATSNDFVPCICPPTDEHPEINVPAGSGCTPGDTLAAEIKIENYGDFLVATSLNLRLSYLPKLSEELASLPLYIVADTVRVDATIYKDNSNVIVNSRRLVVSKKGNLFDPKKWKFFATEIDISDKNRNINSFEVQSQSEISNEFRHGLHQLLDFVELKAITTNTFDTRNEQCPGIESRSNLELDSLTPTFSWLREQGRLGEDESLVWRAELLHKYRGDTLEGSLVHDNLVTEDTLEELESKISLELETEFQALRTMTYGSLSQLKKSSEMTADKMLVATTHLLRGTVSKEVADQDWAMRLSLFTKAIQIQNLIRGIENPNNENDIIIKDLKSLWPKENDFEDFKYLIHSVIGQTTNKRLLKLKETWIKMIRNVEQLYQVKNVKFDLRLKTLLNELKTHNRQISNYQQRLNAWKESKVIRISNSIVETKSDIHLSRVPAQIFANGEFSQRIWVSDQRFNDHAYLSVQDIKVSIDDISTEYIKEHMKITPVTSVIYNINEVGQQIMQTSLPVSYPLTDTQSAISPFTLWRFVPDEDLAEKLSGKQTLEITIEYKMSGILVPGLDGRVSGDDECLQFQDSPLEFTECKFGGEAPFHNTYDIVNVMHLREINNLFKAKYDHQLAGGDSGVVTDITTPWSDSYDNECVDLTSVGLGILNVSKSVMMETVLGAPLMYFPPNLPGYMELHYKLEECTLTTQTIVTNCETGQTSAPMYNDQSLSGTIILVVSLEKIHGEVDEENGKVILDMESTAVTDVGFTFNNPFGKPKLLEQIKNVFQNSFTSTEIATVQYDPKLAPPSFVQPSKFFFQTICDNCAENEKDEGYLITVYETKSMNHVNIPYPKDPHAYGLDHAIPDKKYTAGVFLGAHITFCDVYYHSFQDGLSEQRFNVRYEQSSNPDKPFQSELYIKYLTDMCIHFGGDVIEDDHATLSVYQNTFKFNSQTEKAHAIMNNNRPTRAEGSSGEILGKLLAGFETIMENCYGGEHCEWWEWLLDWTGAAKCLVDLLLCVFKLPLSFEDAYEDSTISIFKDSASLLQYQPECYSFKFPKMDFVPDVDIQLSGEGNSKDQEVKQDTKEKISSAAKEVLALHLTESPSVSLFSAVNLLFPGQKVIDAKEFFSPGTVVMYGNIVKDYEEVPSFGPECAPYNAQTGKFIHF